jgi:hypothetical protein
MAYLTTTVDVDVQFDISEYLNEASDLELITEIQDRGYEVVEADEYSEILGENKCPTDHWKDEYIAQAYNELNWEEWRDMIEAKLAEKKGGKK